MRRVQIILTVLIISGCLSHNEDGEDVVYADTGTSFSASLSELGGHANLIPVFSDETIGNIYDARKYGDRFFLYDNQHRSIWIVDSSGKPFHFNRLGRGPDEYLDIFGYSFNEDREELVIYSRNGGVLKVYSIIDGSLVRQFAQKDSYGEGYYNAMETVGNGMLMRVKQNSQKGSDDAAVVRYDLNNGEEEVVLPLRPDQARIADFMSQTTDGHVVLGVCGERMTFYELGYDGIKQLFQVRFPYDSFWDSYWRRDYSEERFDDFGSYILKQKDGLAIEPGFFTSTEDASAFWFMTKANSSTNSLPDRDCCIIRDGKAEIYSTISCPELGIDRLQPLGTDGESYISLITAEETVPQPGTELGDAFLAMQAAGVDTALLIYDLL